MRYSNLRSTTCARTLAPWLALVTVSTTAVAVSGVAIQIDSALRPRYDPADSSIKTLNTSPASGLFDSISISPHRAVNPPTFERPSTRVVS
ncbi:MAG: hypothetical protein [Circular genetic element sp.]|nr:MAG: hypothetical protein [Circular genetic element sp.]